MGAASRPCSVQSRHGHDGRIALVASLLAPYGYHGATFGYANGRRVHTVLFWRTFCLIVVVVVVRQRSVIESRLLLWMVIVIQSASTPVRSADLFLHIHTL